MLFLVDIGAQIAVRRKAVGLTQSELANRARIGMSTLDALENGRLGELGYVKVNSILAALGMEFSLQPTVSVRPTLDELLLENQREDAALRSIEDKLRARSTD